MDNTHVQLDTALERLLNGEGLEALQREFPAHAAELASYAELRMHMQHVAATMKPSEDGLRRALSSMRVHDVRAEAVPSFYVRVSSFMTTYKTALLLPVLVLMIMATGSVMTPRSPEPDGMSIGDTQVAGSEGVHEARVATMGDTTSADSGAPQSMLFKAAPSETQTPMPEDQELASVFANEMQRDRTEAQAAESDTAMAFDDSERLSGYENTYDADTL